MCSLRRNGEVAFPAKGVLLAMKTESKRKELNERIAKLIAQGLDLAEIAAQEDVTLAYVKKMSKAKGAK